MRGIEGKVIGVGVVLVIVVVGVVKVGLVVLVVRPQKAFLLVILPRSQAPPEGVGVPAPWLSQEVALMAFLVRFPSLYM